MQHITTSTSSGKQQRSGECKERRTDTEPWNKMSWCQENSSRKPPARTSESNCWQINGHMVDWLPLAQTHTVHCSVCKCVCPYYHLSLSLLPSIHPSLLSSLCPPLSSAVSVSLSVFLAHSCYNVTHSHHPNTSPSPAPLPEAVWVCVHVWHSQRPFVSTPGQAAAL